MWFSRIYKDRKTNLAAKISHWLTGLSVILLVFRGSYWLISLSVVSDGAGDFPGALLQQIERSYLEHEGEVLAYGLCCFTS